MLLSGSDFHRAYRPSECDLRLFLHHSGVQTEKPGPYEEAVRHLGERYERSHLATFLDVTDLSEGSHQERQVNTLAAMRDGAAVVYQPYFTATIELAGRLCEIAGVPDFLIREDGGYVIRDVKLSRRITEKDHPEIIWQLRLYGWLFELSVRAPPLRLEVLNGKGKLVRIKPADPREKLSAYAELIQRGTAPYEPVGWSRCNGCGYHKRCWTEAEARNDVALVLKVDKGLARALHAVNVMSYDDLLAQFDEDRLRAFEKARGSKAQKVGKTSASILLSARALQFKEAILVAPPVIPDHTNFVMFDLEGLPPHLDELEKIYLWGLKVFGERPSFFMPAVAAFGADGDKAGWNEFLHSAETIIKTYGNIPFVHWGHYEKVKLKQYMNRYGDPNGIAVVIDKNLFNLLTVMQESVMLPVPSYSLKEVEKYIGFKRTQNEYGGLWAMARYIEATEMEDESARQKVLQEILKYNEEDLGATWAVLCWVKKFVGESDRV